MLCTGINAQAWTAHPDEIYVGVVSITEEKGIMVEHSDADSYSTLDSDGLKVWEYGNDSPVASFVIGKKRENTVDGGGFSGTVWSQKSQYFAFFYGQVEVVYGYKLLVTFYQIFYLYNRCTHLNSSF